MRSKLTSMLAHNICRLRFVNTTARRAVHAKSESGIPGQDSSSTDLAALLEEKLNTELPTQTKIVASIYKVPDRLRSVEPKAYEPNIISIGPYHHGADHLRAMESMKWNLFHRLFSPRNHNRPNLNRVVGELKEIEHKARGCYSEDLKVGSIMFNTMMLIDSCFVIELLRDTKEVDFSKKSIHIKRWMLPVLQRDLIMLENQIPLFVLNKVHDLTNCEDKEDMDLKELALKFFESMMYQDLDTSKNSSCSFSVKDYGGSHFLDLFRASICPTEVLQDSYLRKEPHMFRSITDLKESGAKLKKAEKCQPLDVSFKKGVLRIAPVSMDDYNFTLFRNMVAFEQCHFACKPHVTAYIFFLDRLINSAEDIELLHYAGVMQHTLGGNEHAARLVNKLCKEVAGAADDSYLKNVIWKMNCFSNDGWNQKRAKLKHEYFYNIWVSLSTVAAIVIIYVTILQTVSTLGVKDARRHINRNGFWSAIKEAFLVPLFGVEPYDEDDSSMVVVEDIPLVGDQTMHLTTRFKNFIIWFMSVKEHEILMHISA